MVLFSRVTSANSDLMLYHTPSGVKVERIYDTMFRGSRR